MSRGRPRRPWTPCRPCFARSPTMGRYRRMRPCVSTPRPCGGNWCVSAVWRCSRHRASRRSRPRHRRSPACSAISRRGRRRAVRPGLPHVRNDGPALWLSALPLWRPGSRRRPWGRRATTFPMPSCSPDCFCAGCRSVPRRQGFPVPWAGRLGRLDPGPGRRRSPSIRRPTGGCSIRSPSGGRRACRRHGAAPSIGCWAARSPGGAGTP